MGDRQETDRKLFHSYILGKVIHPCFRWGVEATGLKFEIKVYFMLYEKRSLWLKCLIAKVLSAIITFFLYSAKKAITLGMSGSPSIKIACFLLFIPKTYL